MRIAFAYNFNDSDWFGGRNYFASLFRAVSSVPDHGVEFVFVTGKRTRTSLPDEFPWLEVHRTHMMDRLHPSWLLRQGTLRWADRDPLLARYLGGLHIDLLSHSGYLGPNTGIKTLPWLFDFQFLHLPEHWTPRQLKWVSQRYIASCMQGDGVIVSSEDALSDLLQFVPDTKVAMHVLRFVSNPADLDRLPSADMVRKKYGLPDRFFHLPNQFWTHKNHRVVIDALGILKRRGQIPVVACTGSTSDVRSPQHLGKLLALARNLGIEESFKVLGVIPYVETQALMAHAVAVINPSRFEGWSTTVEEAKTLLRPLLLSDLAVHREQSPELGHFFSPDDPDALADLMTEALERPAPLASSEVVSESFKRRSAAFAHTYLDIVRRTMG